MRGDDTEQRRRTIRRTVDDPRAAHDVAADLAAEQIAGLAAHGVEHVHLYTLNRAELVLAVCERLGVVNPVRT